MEPINRKQNIVKLLIFFVIVAFLMFLFESFKQLLLPHISIWKSHILTIFIVSVFGSFLSYFYYLSASLKKLYAKELNERIQFQQKITEMNINLEKTVEQRTEALEKMNAELCIAKRDAEESNKHKSLMLQDIAHDLRSPLNSIIGFTELLEGNYSDQEKLISYLPIIRQSGMNLLDMISEIMDTARLESGKMTVTLEPVNVNEIIDEIGVFAEGIRKQLGHSNIKFIVNINKENSSKNSKITTDKAKLKRILTNLVTNAFKFTPSGVVELGYNYTDQQFISFYVSDSGIGIDEQQLSSVFERFSQIDGSLSRKYSGTGLGLSIVKGFVELLNGQIKVASVKGEGATFTVTIPSNLDNIN